MKCRLCGRAGSLDEGYCPYHSEALRSLAVGYERWRAAYSELSISDYLRKVVSLNETGSWVKEVAEDILSAAKGDPKVLKQLLHVNADSPVK